MSAAGGAAGAGQPLANIQKAFDAFQQTVKKDDARSFSSTELRDVWAAAKDVEAKLVAKQQARNLRKIQPFLDGLEHYSKAIEVLCNGTPYLPYIWAPIKLCLIIASDSLEAIEKLIKAYGEIAEALPRFGVLADALKDNPDFLNVLALFYGDILDFHQRAYRLFTQNAWQRFFKTTWKRFDMHFGTMLDGLRRHRDLIDAEAGAYNVATTARIAAECRKIRQQAEKQAEEQANLIEKLRTESILPAVLTWLEATSLAVEDDFQRLSDICHPGTCSWFLKHKIVVQWLKNGSLGTKLWVTGKPGSGKSVLSVQLVQHLKTQQDTTVVFHMCNFRTANQNDRGTVLRNLVLQLIAQHPGLSAFVFEEYVHKHREASVTCLKELTGVLLSGLKETRIVIDALDECQPKEQQDIVRDLLTLVDEACKSSDCRLVLFSRDVTSISRPLKKPPRVNLDEESDAISFSIRVLVKHEVSKFTNEQDHLSLTTRDIELLESEIVEKADGMFLWVRLVIDTLEDVHSMHELRLHVHKLPKGLHKAYSRCLDHIAGSFNDEKRAQVVRIFHWIAFAQQPLTVQELLNGVAYSAQPYELDDATALTRAILDLAKPLVEVTSTGAVGFVHFTVKKFLLHKDSGLGGPFLQPSSALRDMIVASCLSLWDCLDLVDRTVDQTQMLLRIVKGYCALQGYSSKHWISHLQQYAAVISSTDIGIDEQIVMAILGLAHRHASLAIALGVSSSALLLRLPYTNSLTPLCVDQHAHLRVEWTAEESDIPDRASNKRSLTVDDSQNPTALCLVHEATARLQTITQELMGSDVATKHPYIDRGQLERFRASNCTRAFSCRNLQCPRRSRGFADERTRDLHERTHATRFLCLEQSCAFNSSIGFASARELTTHRKKFHEQAAPRIPKFRAMRISRDHVSQEHESIQQTYDDHMVQNLRQPLPEKSQNKMTQQQAATALAEPSSSQQDKVSEPDPQHVARQVQQQTIMKIRYQVMDSKPFPRQIPMALGLAIPATVTTWMQLKEHIQQNAALVPQGTAQKLMMMQRQWLKENEDLINGEVTRYLKQQRLLQQQSQQQEAQQNNASQAQMAPPAPIMPPSQAGMAMPQHFEFPTEQDIAVFREKIPQAVGMSDDEIKRAIAKRRRENWDRRAQEVQQQQLAGQSLKSQGPNQSSSSNVPPPGRGSFREPSTAPAVTDHARSKVLSTEVRKILVDGGVDPESASEQQILAAQDYDMQLMLLEQQNKKRLLVAREEHDSMAHPTELPGLHPTTITSGKQFDPDQMKMGRQQQDFHDRNQNMGTPVDGQNFRQSSVVEFNDRLNSASDAERQSFNDALDASRGMVAISQADITPRKISGLTGRPSPSQQNKQANAGHVPDMDTPFGAVDNDQFGSIDFANIDSGDILDNFDFDAFLRSTGPYSNTGVDANSAAGIYASSETNDSMATQAAISRQTYPPISSYQMLQSNTPASIHPPQTDAHGRPLYGTPSTPQPILFQDPFFPQQQYQMQD